MSVCNSRKLGVGEVRNGRAEAEIPCSVSDWTKVRALLHFLSLKRVLTLLRSKPPIDMGDHYLLNGTRTGSPTEEMLQLI